MLVRSRRRFMGACAAVLTSLGVLPLRLSAAESPGVQAFAAMVDDFFYLAGSNGRRQGKVKLIGVTEIGDAPELEQFHVHMRSKPWADIPEGIYTVTNWRGHPNFNLYVQPAGEDSDGKKLYIASFALIR